jgi:hypothetical protein
MSLGVFQNNNATSYFNDSLGKFAAAVDADCAWLDTSWIGSRNSTVWLDRIGLWQTNYTPVGTREGIIRIDPLLIDNTSAGIKKVATSLWFHMGAFTPLAGTQNIYAVATTGNLPWQQVDYNDVTTVLDTDVWANVGSQEPRGTGPGVGVTGYYDTNSNTEWIFFEDWGYALVLNTDVQIDAGLQAQVSALINLSTGFATPIQMPSLYKTAPANDYQSGELFGESLVTFDSLQWLPDDDSTAGAPKGQIFMAAYSGLPDTYHFGKWVEWNPTGALGSPIRTHLRERFISRFQVDPEAVQSSFPGKLSNEIPSSAQAVNRLKINRQTGRPTLLSTLTGGGVASYNGDVYHTAILELTPQAVTSEMTNPAPRQQVTTNRVVIIGSQAVGDLGENVAGQNVTWALQRLATRGEVLPTTPTPGETVAADFSPFDRNSNFPFDVYEDGVPLTETTHYTVNEALGQITFVAPKPLGSGEVYTIDYAHPTSPQSPAFGTLLTAESITDEDGEAFTRVEWPDEDDDAGFVDKITVTTT